MNRETKRLHYFAYGSNMPLARLQARTPSARVLATGMVTGHQLRFHKHGVDGSAKCDLFETGEREHCVHGVVFSLSHEDKSVLDVIEGLGSGYEVKRVNVAGHDGQLREAFTYYATCIRDDLIPWDWYKAYVVNGAREHGLPADYINCIERVIAQQDPDVERRQRNRRILGLD